MNPANQLIGSYLSEVRAATRTLPRLQQDSLVADLEAHIEEALSPGANEAEIRSLLDRLGSPESMPPKRGSSGLCRERALSKR